MRLLSVLMLFCGWIGWMNSSAQSDTLLPVDVVWSDAFRADKSVVEATMVGADSRFLYTLHDNPSRGSRFVLGTFDRKTLAGISERELVAPEIQGHTVSFDRLLLHGGRLVMVVTAVSTEDGNVRAYAVPLNETGQAVELPILLAETTARSTGQTPFGFEQSRDKNLLLIYPGNLSERRLTERYSYQVVDASFETLWEKNLEMPNPNAVMEQTEYRIDNRGQLFLLTGITQPDKSAPPGSRARIDREYTMLVYNHAANRLKEFSIAVDGKWVMATSFDLDDGGNASVGGFFSNDTEFSAAGTFFFRIDGASLKVVASGLKPFSRELLQEFSRYRRQEDVEELEDIYFDHFVVRRDGSALFVAEQHRVEQRWRTDITTGRQEILYYYHYDDLLVVDVNADGSIGWTVRVPKEQVSVNDRGPFSSYALLAAGDEVHIVFNDDPGNAALLTENPAARPEAMNATKRSTAALVSLDADGKMTRQNLFRNAETDVILRPKIWLDGGVGELFLFAQQRKTYRFGLLKL